MNTPSSPVVVGVDGRPAALRAVAWGAREADRRGLPLRLVAAVPDHGTDPVAASRRAHADLVDARRVALANAAVVTSTEVVPGLPGATLAARSREATLVVLGSDTRGPGERRGAPVGSAVTAEGAAPLVVVPARWDLERHLGEVVVAVDPAGPEEVRQAAVALAADVAGRWRRPLLIAVVLPGAHTAPDVSPARRAFDACRREVGADVDVHEVLGHGDPAEELLDLTGPSTGLLVLGASGLASTDAVGRAVRHRARCPVVVVPPGVLVGPLPTTPSAPVGQPA